MRLRATTDENHERFVRRVTTSEQVWVLRGDEGGLAYCVTHDEPEADIFLVFSDAPYARRVARAHFEGYSPEAIHLFHFMFSWLPRMHADGVLAGTNWTGDLVGRECEAAELQRELGDALPAELLEAYEARLE